MNTPSISIEEIARNDFFQDGIYLMAGRKGLDRQVTSISVMEVADFVNFDLGENLLVLTTFSFCQYDEDLMSSIFAELANKSISGVIVKLNRYIENLPYEMLNIADKNNLPLFIIDNHIPFREIIQSVFHQIIHKQYETIFEMNTMYKSLYSSLISNKSIEQYINQLTISKGLDFYIRSQGQILYKSDALTINHDKELLGNSALIADQASENITFENYSEVTIHGTEILIFPIVTSQTSYGEIVIYAKNDDLSMIDKLAFTQLASYLSIKLNELRLNQEERLNNNGRIYNELTSGTTLTEDKAKVLLNSVGFNTPKSYRVIYISFVNSDFSQQKLEKIITKYSNVFYEESSHKFIAYSSGSFRIIYGLDYEIGINDATLESYIDSLKEIFIRDNLPFKIGISNQFSQLYKLPVANFQAKNTILIQRKLPNYSPSHYYNDIWEIDILQSLYNSNESAELIEKVIQPLKEYDECHQVSLLETLEVCILTESLKDVANSLFIHITTLRYRLDKIHVLTGYNYQTNRGKFILTLTYFLSILT